MYNLTSVDIVVIIAIDIIVGAVFFGVSRYNRIR
jgi:hypothetical protein